MKTSFFSLITLAFLASCGVGIRSNLILAPFACTTLPCVYKVDVSDINAGNMGGVAGADSICGDNLPTNGTTSKAFITDGTARVACTTANCSGGPGEHTNWVLAANTTYYLINGSIFGTTDANALLNFPLTNAIESSTSPVWTGFATDWTSSANDCANWSSTAGNGAAATSSGTNTDLLFTADRACNDGTTSLLCVAN